LGELEDAVMTRVWEWNRPVTVREVLEDLRRERSIAYTTVMTVLDNLRQKGWVRREQEGRAYRYAAVSTRAAYSAALMNDAWSESDNPAAALVAFFGMMSPEQTEALRDALRVGDVPGVQLTSADDVSDDADDADDSDDAFEGPDEPTSQGTPEDEGEDSRR
jgi:predicted transcriptional regulator